MTRGYVIFGKLTEENKKDIRKAGEEAGIEFIFYGSPEEASGKVGDGEILFSTGPRLLPEMTHIKWVHTPNAGVDGFIRSGVFDDGSVLLSNSSGSYGRVISEYIIMMSLMLLRRMPEYLESTAEGKWIQNLSIRSIAGSRIAIIGTGDIGSNAATRFRSLGAERVTGFNRSGRMADGFDEVYKLSDFASHIGEPDILVLCVPGTPETRGLLDEDKLRCLSGKTYIINVGRGDLTDQDALIDALNEGRIAGAALDVMVPEPLPEGHPLRSARNCIITPHISGDAGLPYTVDATVKYFCENIRRYADGEELINKIDPSVGY